MTSNESPDQYSKDRKHILRAHTKTAVSPQSKSGIKQSTCHQSPTRNARDSAWHFPPHPPTSAQPSTPPASPWLSISSSTPVPRTHFRLPPPAETRKSAANSKTISSSARTVRC